MISKLNALSSLVALTCLGVSGCGGGGGSSTENASSASMASKAGTLSTAQGWQQIAGTRLQDHCPPNNYAASGYQFFDRCHGIVDAWGSAVMDTQRNRLIVWGGGHNDYYGNEVYAVDLNAALATRLNDPSIPTNLGRSPTDTLPDGTPNSRHTYDGLVYVENGDKMFVFGGAYAAEAGTLGADTWLLDMVTLKWQKLSPSGPVPRPVAGAVTAYDKNSGKVFLHDDINLYSYDIAQNRYTQHTDWTPIDYHMTGTIDHARKKLFIVGGGQAWVYDLTTFQRQAIDTTGASAIVNASSPGLAYDSDRGLIVAWSGGDTVYTYHPDSNHWSSTTYAGGPGAAVEAGTFKRFAYSPTSKAFVLVNSMGGNAYLLRVSAASTPPPAPTPAPPPPAPAPAPTPAPAPVPATGWTRIASEGQSFSVSGTQTVRYGAGSQWVTKTVSGTGQCTNAFFGEDPAYMTVKSCEVQTTAPAPSPAPAPAPTPAPTPAPATDWTRIASEGQSFTVSGTQTVRYGAGSQWIQKSVTGTGQCTNAFFGEDPAYMTVKSCEVQPPAPAPTPAPAPSPSPIAANLSLRLSSPAGGMGLPFTMGQAFQQGHVPNGSTVVSPEVPELQVVVKNRWPDGSAKYAILSGRADLVANTPRTINLNVAAAPAAAAPLATSALAGVRASVQFVNFGTAGWGAADWAAPTQTVVSGPQMSAWTYRKPIGSDKHLVAWLEVRAYKGGRIEFLPWIENGYLNVASPTAKSGTAAFTVNGTQRFRQPLNLLNHQRAVLAGGTTLSHWVGGDPQVTPRHDTTYLMATKLVPNYRGVTASGSTLLAGLPSSYAPLGQASFPDTMGSPGYDPSIGLLPEWDAAYLTSGGDPRAWRGVMINGYAAGRYGTHFRDETTQRPLAFSSYPNLVMGNGAGISGIGASSTGNYTPNASGTTPPTYGSAHHPSMGYMAYLLSGWNYYLEETQLLATANYLKQSNTTRKAEDGVFESSSGSNIPRGAAWATRTLMQAATITPDGDALRTQFIHSVDANIRHYHSKYIAQPNNPLGLVEPYDHYDGTSGAWRSAPWMDDFFTATYGWLKELQVNSSATQAQLDAFLAWKYRSVVGRLGGSGSDAIAYPYAAQYTVYYAPTNSANWANGTGPWYANWGDVARAMGLPTTAASGAALDSGYPDSPTAYWGNLMPALSYAVDHGAAGAGDAWSRITAASNFTKLVNGFNDQPVWGTKPRTR